MSQRKVEIFTSGCYLCEETVQLVKALGGCLRMIFLSRPALQDSRKSSTYDEYACGFLSSCALFGTKISFSDSLLACPDCNVVVYDLSDPCESDACSERSRDYGINAVPAVVVDGKIIDCCQRGRPDRQALMAAGIGAT